MKLDKILDKLFDVAEREFHLFLINKEQNGNSGTKK